MLPGLQRRDCLGSDWAYELIVNADLVSGPALWTSIVLNSGLNIIRRN